MSLEQTTTYHEAARGAASAEHWNAKKCGARWTGAEWVELNRAERTRIMRNARARYRYHNTRVGECYARGWALVLA